MLWSERSWSEIESMDKRIPVVVPLGSCEQHGRHLPVLVDSFQVSALVDQLEAQLGSRALFTPTLWLGASDHHRDFPGRLSLPPFLYSQVIQSYTACILESGFTRIHFLNGHGGNLVPVSQALTDLIVKDDRFDGANLTLGSWWQTASGAIQPEDHGMSTPHLTHACEYETSLMLAIREDLVNLSKLDPAHFEKPRPWASGKWKSKVEGFHRFHRWTSTGHMGDPSQATVAKGRSLLEAVAAEIACFLTDSSQWPPMEPLQ
ncbi:MAG: creatininase family protein [Puniceicoccales bacterium]